MNQWIKASNSILLASVMSLSQLPGQCRADGPPTLNKNQANRLQHAVDAIYVRPKAAEQELKHLPGPTAKAYLAFIYMSRKVALPQAGKKVDSLMHAALTELPSGAPIGDIDAKQWVHYTKMEMLLRALRFISEVDGDVKTPTKIFEQYPEACLKAFAAQYYSSMERADTFELSKSDNIFNIPQVKNFTDTVSKMYGDPGPGFFGTMMYGVYRQQRMASLEASLAPQVYLQELNKADGKVQYETLTDFLQMWANQELWNQHIYAQFKRESDEAIKPLAEHYRRRFNVPAQTARNYAQAALQGYSLVWLDNYSHSTAKESESTVIYKTFSTPGLTLDGVKQKIGQRILTAPELEQALHLAILCGGSLEMIDWLIKDGALLTGGIESPLFSSVTRSDVAALLIKAGADVNEANPLGKTPLIQASQYDALATIKKLLESGADVNHKMLKSGDELPASVTSDPNFNYRTGSRTALMYAAAFSSAPTIEYLISKGADKQAVDSAGWKVVKFLDWNNNLSEVERQRMKQILN